MGADAAIYDGREGNRVAGRLGFQYHHAASQPGPRSRPSRPRLPGTRSCGGARGCGGWPRAPACLPTRGCGGWRQRWQGWRGGWPRTTVGPIAIQRPVQLGRARRGQELGKTEKGGAACPAGHGCSVAGEVKAVEVEAGKSWGGSGWGGWGGWWGQRGGWWNAEIGGEDPNPTGSAWSGGVDPTPTGSAGSGAAGADDTIGQGGADTPGSSWVPLGPGGADSLGQGGADPRC